ncbi:MAG: ABC transporter permease, partial [Acidimicrobiales bacterium]
MNADAWNVIAYRARRTLTHRLRSYLAITLVLGALGGLALGSIAAARRTQSAYPRFLESTNPSTLEVTVWRYTTSTGAIPLRQQDAMTAALSRLPNVGHVERFVFPLAAPITAKGQLERGAISPVASIAGEFFNEDRPGVVAGRMPNPHAVDEFATTPQAARSQGWHVGESINWAVFRPSQFNANGTTPEHPAQIVREKLVGLVEFNVSVLQDQADAKTSLAVFTPAFARADAFGGAGTNFAIQLRRSGSVATTEKGIIAVLPRGAVYEFEVTADAVAKVERSIRPESIALGAFGGVVALAAMAIAAMAIARLIRANEGDREVLRALGATPLVQIGDVEIGVLTSVLAGCALAVGVAFALSPIAPLGSVRTVYPFKGFAFDGAALGLGVLALFVVLTSVAVAIGWRFASAKRSAALIPTGGLGTWSTRFARALGLPAPAVLGVRGAVQSTPVRTAAPARATIFGATLAIVLLVTTLTFGASLSTLVSHPRLYGWNWSYALLGSNDVPPQALNALRHDRDIAAFSGWGTGANIQVDGLTVPTMISDSDPTVAMPMLTGHPVRAANQVVLGPTTLAELHKRVGDTLVLSYGTRADYPIYVPPERMMIVGTATFPAVGGVGGAAVLHPSMGTGMWLEWQAASRLHRLLQGSVYTLSGPNMALIRMRPNVSASAARANLDRIVSFSDRLLAKYQNEVLLLSVQRPAEIVNYRSMGATPSYLALGVVLGAVIALAAALSASVRTRRRELALLKALGFTGRQLAETIIWQATVTALIGIVIGVPIGIAVGRWLWTLFARSIAAVPEPAVPVVSVVLVGIGAIVVANLVA